MTVVPGPTRSITRRPWAWPPARPACARGLDEGEEHRKEDEAVGHDEEADAEELLLKKTVRMYLGGSGEGEGYAPDYLPPSAAP